MDLDVIYTAIGMIAEQLRRDTAEANIRLAIMDLTAAPFPRAAYLSQASTLALHLRGAVDAAKMVAGLLAQIPAAAPPPADPPKDVPL